MRLALERRRDERLLAYAAAAAAALIVGLFTSRVDLVGVGGGFAVVIATASWSRRAHVEVDGMVRGDRFIEGDVVEGELSAHLPGSEASGDGENVTIEVMIEPSSDLPPVSSRALAWEHTHGLNATFVVRARRWGRYVIGPTSVRVRDPTSLVHWECTAHEGPTLVVLPSAFRSDRILEPRSSRTVAGSHLARRVVGSGVDFAELQWYQPGDRLRDLNVAATARSSRPVVNRRHPERSGDVIILLDTFIDSAVELSTSARRVVVLEARAAWAIARSHLAAQDRVGVATVGRHPVWLPPAAGRRGEYALLDALLSVGEVLEAPASRAEWLDANRIPPAALVVLISPLWSNRYFGQLARVRARGRETAVIQLRTEALLMPAVTADEALARRVFAMLTDDRVRELRRAGIDVVQWDPTTDLGAAVSVAARMQVRRRTARSV